MSSSKQDQEIEFVELTWDAEQNPFVLHLDGVEEIKYYKSCCAALIVNLLFIKCAWTISEHETTT